MYEKKGFKKEEIYFSDSNSSGVSSVGFKLTLERDLQKQM